MRFPVHQLCEIEANDLKWQRLSVWVDVHLCTIKTTDTLQDEELFVSAGRVVVIHEDAISHIIGQ
jgi:hypothetical protein